jgi:PhzF family phenazine biosynthesis protein
LFAGQLFGLYVFTAVALDPKWEHTMSTQVFIVNAFTRDGAGGNPAGVVLGADALGPEEMQRIAMQMGVSETAFVSMGVVSDHDVRFFTPTSEVALCGHGTIATYATLLSLGHIKAGTFTMNTPAGVQTIVVGEDELVSMTQNLPTFGPTLEAAVVADALGIDVSELSDVTPIQVVSTGLNKIHAPLRRQSTLDRLKPDLDKVSSLSKAHASTGIMVWTTETAHGSTARCRNFSPAVGISEDPATGTACAGLSCLLYKYGVVQAQDCASLTYEQGYSLGLPSLIEVALQVDATVINEVVVRGRAAILEQRWA